MPSKNGDITAALPALGTDEEKLRLLAPDDLNILFTKKPHDPERTKPPFIVHILITVASVGAFLVGYHTCIISGAMLSLKDEFHLNYEWQELIVSGMVGVATVSSVGAGYINELCGRKPTLLIAGAAYIIGSVILVLARNRGLLLAGRSILGIGIGLVASTSPMYIAEAAPIHLRGLLVTVSNLFMSCGQLIATVVAGLCSVDRQNGWRYMFGIAGAPSVVMFVGILFMPESPKWLVSREKYTEARAALCKIRGAESDIEVELQTIMESQRKLLKQAEYPQDTVSTLLRMFRTHHVLRALVVGCGLHVIQMFSGINIVLPYVATLVKMSGVRDSSEAIWLSALAMGVKFVFTFVALYLVERTGRKVLTVASLIGTLISLCVLAAAFQLALISSVTNNRKASSALSNSTCAQSFTCDECIQSQSCGFCYQETSVWSSGGLCLPSHSNQTAAVIPRGSEKSASGWLWSYGHCPTHYTQLTLAGLVLFFASYAIGLSAMPWTINSEIYPQWASSTGNGLASAVHWLTTLLSVSSFLSLTKVLSKPGVFWLYAGLTLAGIAFTVLLLPETKGKSTEEVEELFKRPW